MARIRSTPLPPQVEVVHTTGDIGRHIRAHRQDQALRIDTAAELIGVSVDLLSRLENGAGGVRTDKLLEVLDGLGLALVIAPKHHALLRELPVAPPSGPPAMNPSVHAIALWHGDMHAATIGYAPATDTWTLATPTRGASIRMLCRCRPPCH